MTVGGYDDAIRGGWVVRLVLMASESTGLRGRVG